VSAGVRLEEDSVRCTATSVHCTIVVGDQRFRGTGRYRHLDGTWVLSLLPPEPWTEPVGRRTLAAEEHNDLDVSGREITGYLVALAEAHAAQLERCCRHG
jgi:hypothetical protein